MADNVPVTAGSGTTIATDGTSGVHYQRIKLTDGTEGSSVAITGTATNGLLVDVSRVQGSVQIATTAGAANNPVISAQVTGYGHLRIAQEAGTLLYDPFDTLDTTVRWAATQSGTAAATTQGSGGITVSSGTAASGYAVFISQPTFFAIIPGFLQVSSALSLPDGGSLGVTKTSRRFWGWGSASVAPATTSDSTFLTDAVGWEIDTTGALLAVVYANGVRTTVATLTTSITNTSLHRYLVQYRTDKIYWYIDSLDVPVANASFTSPVIQTLPVRFQSVNTASAAAASQLICSGVAIADTAKNGTQISDGTYAWRKASITSTGNLNVAAVGPTASGSTATTAPVLVAGTDIGSNVRNLRTDTSGNLNVLEAGGVDTVQTATAINTVGTSVVFASAGLGDIACFLSLTGYTSGTATFVFEATVDGTNWVTLYGFSSSQQIMVSQLSFTAISSDACVFSAEGYASIRIRSTVAATGQVATAYFRGSVRGGPRRIAAFQANAVLPTLIENQPSNAAIDLTGALYITNKPSSSVAVSAATLPLPTGAAAGVAQSSTTSGQSGVLIQGAVSSSIPTYVTGQTSPLSLDTTGCLRVNISSDSSFVFVEGQAANGAAVPSTSPVLISGSDGTFVRNMLTDTSGRQITKEAKDSSRTLITFLVDAAAFVTTEALTTAIAVNKAGVVTSAQTTYTVTTGKTLRIQSIDITYILGSTTISNLPKIRIRAVTSGTAVVTSGILWSTTLPSPTGTGAAGEGITQHFDFPDGFEIASAWNFGISDVMPTAASGSWTLMIVAYEY